MTDVAPNLVTSVCGEDFIVPSSGESPGPVHFDEIERAAADVSDEQFYESRRALRSMVVADSEDFTKEDLQYYEQVLAILAAEWMKRIWGGTPEDVAQDTIDNLTLEEVATFQDELVAEEDEDWERMHYLPCERDVVTDYYEAMHDVCETARKELSTSIKVNATANKQEGNDTTSPSKGCGAKKEAVDPQEQIVVDLEAVSPPRTARQHELIETQDEYVEEHPEVATQRDRMERVSCEGNGCDGYPVKNKIWYCDELVTGIRKPRDDPEYWSSTEYNEIWYGGGQLGYAAWANAVTVTVKCVEEGIIEGAKTTASVFGSATGWIGVGLGTIDLGLCAARWGKTNTRINDLKKLFSKHFTNHPTEVEIQDKILTYAVAKKNLKFDRAMLATYFALVGVVGGVIGGIAFLASNPVGWAVALGLGVAAVLAGLGFLTWKGINKAKKILLARKERVRLINCYRKRTKPHPNNASAIIRAIDRDEGDTDDAGYYEVAGNDRENDEVLTELLKKYTRMRRKTERQAMASAIVAFFVAEADRFLHDHANQRVKAEGKKSWMEKRKDTKALFKSLEDDGWLDNNFGGAILAALNKNPAKMIIDYARAKRKDHDRGSHAKCQKLMADWIQDVMGKLKSW